MRHLISGPPRALYLALCQNQSPYKDPPGPASPGPLISLRPPHPLSLLAPLVVLTPISAAPALCILSLLVNLPAIFSPFPKYLHNLLLSLLQVLRCHLLSESFPDLPLRVQHLFLPIPPISHPLSVIFGTALLTISGGLYFT